MVVKKDGRREKFERQKVLSGLLRACEKRPVSASKLEIIVNDTETFLVDSPERERTTSEIGELIMDRLKTIDTVAYIRFASVLSRLYRTCASSKKNWKSFSIPKTSTKTRKNSRQPQSESLPGTGAGESAA